MIAVIFVAGFGSRLRLLTDLMRTTIASVAGSANIRMVVDESFIDFANPSHLYYSRTFAFQCNVLPEP